MVLFAIGLLGKPVLVTVPFVLLLLDYWPLGRICQRGGADIPVCLEDRGNSGRQECLPHQQRLWRLVAEKVPLLALAAGCCYIVLLAERTAEYPARGAYWRIGNALISYVVYLRQFFWPSDLAMLYPRRGPDLPVWQVVGAGLIVLGITAAVLVWRRKHPYLLVGWLWYLAMMLPMVGLVAFGNEAPADRFTYLPQIGVAVALAWWAADWCRPRPYRRWVYAVGSVLAVLVLMGCAIRPGIVLAQQRNALEADARLHVGQSLGSQPAGQCIGQCRPRRRSGIAVQGGDSDQARLLRGLLQSRRRRSQPRSAESGDGLLPEGDCRRSQQRPGPQQSRIRLAA